jgi:hypothetical protein
MRRARTTEPARTASRSSLLCAADHHLHDHCDHPSTLRLRAQRLELGAALAARQCARSCPESRLLEREHHSGRRHHAAFPWAAPACARHAGSHGLHSCVRSVRVETADPNDQVRSDGSRSPLLCVAAHALLSTPPSLRPHLHGTSEHTRTGNTLAACIWKRYNFLGLCYGTVSLRCRELRSFHCTVQTRREASCLQLPALLKLAT